MTEYLTLGAVAAAGAIALPKAYRRLQLSRAKHRSLAGHSKWSKRIARLLPYYEFNEERFFAADGAPTDVISARKTAFEGLGDHFKRQYAQSIAATRELAEGLPDVEFTGNYKVPFQFRKRVSQALPGGSVMEAASGVTVTDLDGNTFLDLSGSYGVNLMGVDFYRECIEAGMQRVAALGPILGPLHPIVQQNVRDMKRISGLDKVSFHMSGTEAVMQAVRLARYHTGRRQLVRFCGAYHGWWGEVQPGIGNPVNERNTLTLAECSEKTLTVLKTRKDIACVLINPLQALHPNGNAPGDSTLVDSSRNAGFDRESYTTWLKQLREVCTQRGIVMIMDEVFLGFRLAPGGARQYFDVQADMVTYGKTLGGGLPIGVLCGRADLMKRYRDERPADICFARGTFNSHPYVMGAMREFLDRIETPEIKALYDGMDERWNARAERLNHRLREAGIPVRVANMSTVWTILFDRPSRYNWMLQFYLRKAGLWLSWVGSGRMIFTLNYTDELFADVCDRFVEACREMERDGWWWKSETLTNKSIKRMILAETLQKLRGR